MITGHGVLRPSCTLNSEDLVVSIIPVSSIRRSVHPLKSEPKVLVEKGTTYLSLFSDRHIYGII